MTWRSIPGHGAERRKWWLRRPQGRRRTDVQPPAVQDRCGLEGCHNLLPLEGRIVFGGVAFCCETHAAQGIECPF